MILGPEHQGRAKHNGAGHGLKHRGLAFRLGAVVARGRLRIGAEHGDMRQVGDAGAARGLGHGARAEDVDGVKTLAPAFIGNRDEVDDRVGIHDGAIDRPAVAEVGLHGLDPAHHAERLEVAGEIGTADGGADAPAALEQRADDMAAKETRATEDGDQTLVAGGNGHRRAPECRQNAASPAS